jgi:hypothetical protein
MKGAAITRLGTNMDTCRPVTEDGHTTARVVTLAGSAAGTTAGTVKTNIAGEGRMAADPATAKEDTAAAEATVADSRT